MHSTSQNWPGSYPGYYDANNVGSKVTLNGETSLYRAQLNQRMANPHETKLEYWVGDFDSYANDGASDAYDPKDQTIVDTIKELLQTRVRPAVAQDGGDITFSGFRDGVVYLHMRGACSGCPSSTATLRHGIENLLRHFCPEVQEVRAA